MLSADLGARNNIGVLNAHIAALEEEQNLDNVECSPENVPRLSEAYAKFCEVIGTEPTYRDPLKKAKFVQALLNMLDSTHNIRCGKVEPAKWKPFYYLPRRTRRALYSVIRRHNRAWSKKETA